MGIANYVFRRGRFYVWRRLYRGKPIQVPLATADPFEAKRLAYAASAASVLGWNLLDRGTADLLTIREGIPAAVRRTRLTIDYEAAGGDPAHLPEGRAFFFFFGLLGDAPDEPQPPRKPARRAEPPQPPRSASEAVAPPRPRLAPARGTSTGFSARIPDVVSRMSATHARTGRANAKTLTQLRAIADLFCEITGLDDGRDIRQHHLVQFVTTLDQLPPAYRRSAGEREKPIAEIVADAAAGIAVRLSVATVNRNLVHLGEVLKAAQAEGLRIDSSPNPALLRRFSKRAAKDDREAFTPEDVRLLFAAPVWTGCQSAKRRRQPGAIILKDWTFWVPLIAAYTGTRREEICGLETADVGEVDGVPVFHIRSNARRGLKNPQSERLVPVHSHLIELGFLDFAQGQRIELLPDPWTAFWLV